MIPTPRGTYRLAAVVAVAWAANLAPAAEGRLSAAERRSVDGAIRTEMQRQEVVGVAIGVLRGGRIAYLQGYGLADRETQRPVTTRTVFNWASNSKPLVAVAAMQLVEAGGLDLDADVRRYVPEFPAKSRGVVTTRHLLCHQSGLPHYSNGEVVPIDPIDPGVSPCDSAVAAISRFAASPLIFAPGERVDYSSHAYVLLSAVVARAGQAPVREQIEQRITGPLGMDSWTTDVAYAGQADWATGYRRSRGGEVRQAEEYAHCWKHGAGGYKSSVADFAKWAAALLRGGLVEPSTRDAMWTIQPLASGEPTKWGLGFTLNADRRLKVSHNGSQPETRTRMVLYPQAAGGTPGHGVVVMCNCEYANPGRFSTAVYTALRR